MKRKILTLALILFSPFALAQREIPDDADVAVLKKVELPYLKLSKGGFSWTRLLTLGIVDGNSATFQITRFTKIRDEKDRFMPMGRLLQQNGKSIAFRRNPSGLVQEIWILSDGEAQQAQEQKPRRDMKEEMREAAREAAQAQ